MKPKKSLAVFLLFIMLLSVVNVQANVEAVQNNLEKANQSSNKNNKEIDDATKVLKSLGLIESDFDIMKSITRGQATEYLIKLGGCNPQYNTDYTYFNDVGSKHKNFASINIAYLNGFISGYEDGSFNPDEYITVCDFTASVLNLAGFGDYAKAKGDYPANYLSIAYERKLLKSGDGKDTDALKGYNLICIIYRALDLPVLKESSILVDNDHSIKFSEDDDVNVISTFLNIQKLKGTVVASHDIYIGNRRNVGKGSITIDCDGEEYTYGVGYTDIEDYVGFTVEYYVPDDDSHSDDIICFVPITKNVDEITLVTEDIYEIPDNLMYIEYQRDEDYKTNTARFSNKTTFVYNGKRCYEILKEDFLRDLSRIRMIDFDGDDIFDLVYVYNFEVMFVESVSVTNNSIIDKITGSTLDVDVKSGDFDLSIIKNGSPIGLSDVITGDFLLIATSKADSSKQKRTIYVSSNTVSGKVTSISAVDKEIYIDDTKYKASRNISLSDIAIGNPVTVGIDQYGYVVCCIKNQIDGINYGYLINIKESSGVDKTIKARIFCTDNTIKIFDFTDNFYFNRVKGKWSDLKAQLFINDTVKNQLVSFVLNDDGKIKEFYSAADEQGVLEKDTVDTLTLNKRFTKDIYPSGFYINNLNGEFYIQKDSTKIFVAVHENNGNVIEEYLQIVTDPSRIRSRPEIYVYDAASDRIPKAIVVTFTSEDYKDKFDTYFEANNRHYFVVSKIVDVLNENGEYVQKVSGYMDGKPAEFIYDSNINKRTLSPGDVVLSYCITDNNMLNFRLRFSLKKPSYTVNGALFGDFPYDNKTAETTATVGDPLSTYSFCYGTLTKKTSIGNINIVQVTIKSSSAVRVYGCESSARFYSFDKNTQKVEAIRFTDLEIDKETFLVSRNNLTWDIVQYK